MKTLLLLCVGAASLLSVAQAADLSLGAKAAEPLDNAYAMKEDGIVAYDEGKSQPLAAPATLMDGSLLEPSGLVSRPDGVKFSLEMGQVITRAGDVQEPSQASEPSETTAPAVKPQ